MLPTPNPRDRYAHAPRLPDGPSIDLHGLLSGTGPIEIEIGPGRGAFLLERAAIAPSSRLLGFEIRRKWATLVDERLARQGLGARARVLCEDARLALPRLGPEASVATVFLHFPDPWWKKRHQKRLVMGTSLLDSVARLLTDAGELYLQTDVEERAAQFEELATGCAALQPAGDEPGSPRMAANPYGARSNRERRVEADGLPVHRLRYRRIARHA
jgi:tRNA (guanine-N7-)-methyltransferase